MANIIFTNRCNIRCPFCFATENNFKSDSTQEKSFSIEESQNISKFLKNKVFKFCGGEPTQNPNIIGTVEALLQDNFKLSFMTNGIWPKSFLDYVKQLSSESILKISYLFNILEKSFYTQPQLNILYAVLETVNPINSKLGITIYKKGQDFSHILDLAEKNKIKHIRLSIAAPYISSGEYKLENDFFEIAQEIHQLVLFACERNILINGDCGTIPPCYYNDDMYRDITSLSTIKNFACKFSAIDIDNDGNSWRCYGLYPILRQNIRNFKNEEELGKYFDRRIKILKGLYLYKECKTCKYWYKTCTGSCHAVRIKKAINKNPDICLFPIDDEIEVLNCKPKISDKIVLKSSNDNKLITIFKDGCIINNIDENSVAFLSEIDGEKKISDLITKWEKNFSNYQNAKNTIIEKCRELFELDFVEVNYYYNYESENRPRNLTT